jgi:hypothetical protein
VNVKANGRLSRPIHPSGRTLWFAVLAGIGAWMVHLVALAGLARWTCNDDGSRWVLDVLTVAMAAVTAFAIWLCAGIVRGAHDDDAGGTPAARTRWLGVFGIMLGAINLALIVVEGSYAWFISPCA